MEEIICGQCGTRNAAGTQFCTQCQTFLAWADPAKAVAAAAGDSASIPAVESLAASTGTAVDVQVDSGPTEAGTDIAWSPTTVFDVPAGTDDPRLSVGPVAAAAAVQPPAPAELLRVALESAAVALTPAAAPTTVPVRVQNLSPIVDAYRVSAPLAPSWLEVTAAEVRLLPNAVEQIGLGLRIPAGPLVPAGTTQLMVRVQSIARPEVIADHQIELTVLGVNTPLVVRLTPTVVRARDDDTGRLEASVDNSLGNQPRRVTLAGRDPEGVVRFTFAPPVLDVPAGGTAAATIRVAAPPPEPGRELTRQLTIVAADDRQQTEAGATFIQTASVEVPVSVKLEPSLVRVRDASTGHVEVVIDNRRGSRPLRLALAGTDPERAVRFALSPAVVEVAPGQTVHAHATIDAYPPEPGREISRAFSITAYDGTNSIEASGTFVQTTSPLPPDQPVTVRLEPSVLRSRNRDHALSWVTVDNRAGHRGRRVQLSGNDPERVVGFAFEPVQLDVAPGQVGRAQVRVSARRPDGGEQVSRPFSVVAADGTREVEASGTFVQESSDRRPLWRLVLTLVGGLLMIAGSFLNWNTGASIDIPSDLGRQVGPDIMGVEWDVPAVDVATDRTAPGVHLANLPDGLDPVVSAGGIMIVLGALVMFGLIGTSGRLTRLAALVGALAVIGFAIFINVQDGTGNLGPGVFVVLAGCVIAFIGGVLARPRRG